MYKNTESGAVTEDDFEESFSTTSAIDIDSEKSLKLQIDIVRRGFESDDWEKRIVSLQIIRGLAKSRTINEDDFMQNLNYLAIGIEACISDLRSQVVKDACITVAFLSKVLLKKFDIFVEKLVGRIVALVPLGVKILSSSGKVALRYLVTYSKSNKMLLFFTSQISESKSAPIRQYLCELLAIVCESWSNRILEKCEIGIALAIKKGVSDADPLARSHSRMAFCWLHKRVPKVATKIFSELDSGKQSALKKDLNSFSNVTANKLPALPRAMSCPRVPTKIQAKSVGSSAKGPARMSKDDSTSLTKSKISKESSCSVSTVDSSRVSDKASNAESEFPLSEMVESFYSILNRLRAKNLMERQNALKLLEIYLHQNVLGKADVKRAIDVFSYVFYDQQTTFIKHFLSVLQIFIRVNYELLFDWMPNLLGSTFYLRATIPAKVCADEALNLLIVIRNCYGGHQVFKWCCHLLADRDQDWILKKKICVMEFCIIILSDIGSDGLDLNDFDILHAVALILNWSEEKKSLELRYRATDVLKSMKAANVEGFDKIITRLPNTSQGKAEKLLASFNAVYSTNQDSVTDFLPPKGNSDRFSTPHCKDTSIIEMDDDLSISKILSPICEPKMPFGKPTSNSKSSRIPVFSPNSLNFKNSFTTLRRSDDSLTIHRARRSLVSTASTSATSSNSASMVSSFYNNLPVVETEAENFPVSIVTSQISTLQLAEQGNTKDINENRCLKESNIFVDHQIDKNISKAEETVDSQDKVFKLSSTFQNLLNSFLYHDENSSALQLLVKLNSELSAEDVELSDGFINAICPILSNYSLNDKDSAVRKTAYWCIISIYGIIKEDLWTKAQWTEPQKRLLKFYISKKQ